MANILNPEEVNPVEPWFGTVISLADGLHTVQELIDYLATLYPQGAPSNLEKTLDSVLERLVEGNLVRMSDSKVSLPYYLAEPIESLDLEKARKLVHEDGYIQH